MNEMQDIQIESADLAGPLELTFDDVLDVAGGPQVLNDGPALIATEDLAAVSGGPQVVNDGPPT